VREDGEGGKEKIPLPDSYGLGLDERGRFLNHSGRYRNNFGANREALFPGVKDKKREVRNWIATFTKSGCIACRDDDGHVNHKGKDGTPLVMVIGDEATPTVVGYTPPGSEENTCAWVLKKEHLALDEVALMLRRINEEKKLADKMRGKREHEFFIPNGSKILVSSYVHLRREGLEGYVTDFNNMVRGVQEVTGDTGVEVLPVVPVVFEGLDNVGRELLGGLRGWIEWIAEQTGRAEIKELAKTGGREQEESKGNTTIWKPTFMAMHGKKAGLKTVKKVGNTLTLLRGDRVEWEPRGALPAREIKRMVEKQGEGENEKLREERVRRESFEGGISVEGEFAFTKAVGSFCSVSKKEGNFAGPQRLNLRDQMEKRAKVEKRAEEEVKVVLVGGSQIRLKEGLREWSNGGVRVIGTVRIVGELTEKEAERALSELAEMAEKPDKVVIGGPTNSLMLHGKGNDKGFGPERTVVVRKDVVTGVQEWVTRYHMTDPKHISMADRRTLVDRTVSLIRGAQATFPMSEVNYLSMFPGHVTVCWSDHMTEEDVWMMDGIRREVDREVKDLLTDCDDFVTTL
jgi:hypothetical protein